MIEPAQADVWWVDFGPPAGMRPALVLTRNAIIRRLTSVTVAPITGTIRGVPSEVELSTADDGVERPSVVSLDNLSTLPKEMLQSRMTTLSPQRMNEVWEALHFAFDMPY